MNTIRLEWFAKSNKTMSAFHCWHLTLLVFLIGIYLFSIYSISPRSTEYPHLLRVRKIISSLSCSSKTNQRRRSILQGFLAEESIIARSMDCVKYFEIVDIVNQRLVSEAQEQYPIAMSHSVHDQIGILEMFLALMFRPQDLHCIHVDLKASEEVMAAISGVVKCYKQKYPDSEIFIPKYRVPVFWGYDSVLEADMICMRELLKSEKPWKVYINPAGSEMPLVSSRVLRRELKSLHNRNYIDYEIFNKTDRQHKVFVTNRFGPKAFDIRMKKLRQCWKPPPPYNITVLKAQKNVVLQRSFVNFLVYHPVAIDYYNWLSDSFIPDEHFYSTMASITVERKDNNTYIVEQIMPTIPNEDAFCFRKSLWNYPNCSGQNIHWICKLGVMDLPIIQQSNCLMANKFNVNSDPIAIFCQMRAIL
ncbi:N-acetyllactosaminide beta-1,6-N-acetylglucosaminyl-transferase-like [Tigriopus californicus]|uniref:N-acetyllactosaminide beta-1,6-N-acetylglucosaminyl-transferase-like n=1 Tax=Tigriopus californicus TaxID=6832 RepID=UPI0027DA19DF|nr:N-acetyllactosaminide beta-1,6-N-acetylglucosaminyl-transferase-like [Tigriopus californicus]